MLTLRDPGFIYVCPSVHLQYCYHFAQIDSVLIGVNLGTDSGFSFPLDV